MASACPALKNSRFTLAGVGEPLGAFVAAYLAVEIGGLVAGSPVLSSTLTNEYLKRKGWTWLALIARPVEWHLTGC